MLGTPKRETYTPNRGRFGGDVYIQLLLHVPMTSSRRNRGSLPFQVKGLLVPLGFGVAGEAAGVVVIAFVDVDAAVVVLVVVVLAMEVAARVTAALELAID